MLKSKALTRLVYLVEGHPADQDLLSPGALTSAITSTQAKHGFTVIRTACLEQTIAWVGRMHRALQASDRLVDVRGTTYEAFAAECAAMRALSVGDVHKRMLRQLPGCSAAVASAIAEHHPTPAALFEACTAPHDPGARLAGQGPKMTATIRDVYAAESYARGA